MPYAMPSESRAPRAQTLSRRLTLIADFSDEVGSAIGSHTAICRRPPLG